MPGRSPKPTKIKVLEGNRGKKKLNTEEPQPDNGMPACPEFLSEIAQAEWHRLAPQLHRIGVLTQVDGNTLAAYCSAFDLWQDALRKTNQHGTVIKSPSGYPIQSPWVAIVNKQVELMNKLAGELGITPASRSRIKVDPKVLKKSKWRTSLDE